MRPYPTILPYFDIAVRESLVLYAAARSEIMVVIVYKNIRTEFAAVFDTHRCMTVELASQIEKNILAECQLSVFLHVESTASSRTKSLAEIDGCFF